MRTLPRRRIVVKLGTQVVMNDDGKLASARLQKLVKEIATATASGHELILISSGAVGLGRVELANATISVNELGRQSTRGKRREPSVVLAEKQACAAVGQSLLMENYRQMFQPLKVAQLLLTAQDFSDRVHYLNLRRTLEMILKLGAVPVINENDSVSVLELLTSDQGSAFGDNDALSAIVASKMGAELLILLTNVDGVYSANPRLNKDAVRIPAIANWDHLKSVSTDGTSTEGRGGMQSKLMAARLASKAGVRVVIASGFEDNTVSRAIATLDSATDFGTWIQPATKRMNQRSLWIAGSSGFKGQVVINEGAKRALIERNASLLVAGILKVTGEFEVGDVVKIIDEAGRELGRGITRWNVGELKTNAGLSKLELEKRGLIKRSITIHKDDIVLSESAVEHEQVSKLK